MAFNEKQQEVIDTINGPVLVVSCPGSGKTTVVVERAHKMVESGIIPWHILVITFTKASAEEMKQRYVNKFGDCGITFCTIHSVCLFMLSKAYGLTAAQLIQPGEQYSFIQTMIGDEDISDIETATKNILQEIGWVKNRDLNIDKYESESLEDPMAFRRIFKGYEKYKKERNIFDFDDILIITRNYLRDNENALAFWQDYFQYLMIDEYQDTNTIQAEIFYAIARKHRNICVVGDDDQGIYGFRAADSSIMMNFEKEFKGCKKIFMDTNYRSAGEIISHARMLIDKNTERFPKDFKVGRTDLKGTIKYIDIDEFREAERICEELKLDKEAGKDMSKTAILYRNNNQASGIVSFLIKNEIPFSVSDSFEDVHDSIMYQDILAYYRLANDQAKYGDFAKIINKPTRYLKQSNFLKVDGLDIKAILKIVDEKVDERWKRMQARDSLRMLVSDIKALSELPPKKFFSHLEKSIHYLLWMRDYASYANQEYADLLSKYKVLKSEAFSHNSMEDWFIEVEKQKKIIQEKKKKKNREDKEKGVRLSTFHSSKGLEWDKVYIIDANEGIAPSRKATTDKDIEEERRLFYVAMTRAKTELYIYFDSMGKEPSRFLEESGAGQCNEEIVEEITA